VLHIIKSLDRGGAEVLLAELARIAPSRGVTFDVAYYLPQHRRMVDELRSFGIEPHLLESSSTAAMLGQIGATARLIRAVRPDVVHAHLPVAGAVARLAAAAGGVPVVYTEHNVFDRYHPMTQLLSTATWTMQEQVIAVSDVVAATLPKGVPVTVVKNGIPVERFAAGRVHRAAVRAELGVAEDVVVVGTVAVFRTAKRLDRFVATVEGLVARGINVRGVLVGYGPLEAEVRAAVARSPASSSLMVLGASNDVPRLLSAFDVWLMTSDHEGLPLALLEAMAASLPVVATSVGGIPEVITDGETGVLVDKDDAVGIVDAVAELAGDASVRSRLGSSAQELVRRRFGIEGMLEALVDVYGQAA
jgi:glycosyltransferase involved in cell wall biosynthesis